MRAFTTGPAAARRRSATGLLYLVISGLLWGTGGLTGSLLGRTAGLSAIAVAACRLTAGGVLIVVFLTVTGFGFTIGGLALMPLAQMAGGISFRPGLAAVGLLIALGTGPTAVAYTLYFRGLRSAPASTAALLSLLEPLTGTILAAVLLGERLSATGIAGAAIIAAAMILTVRANRGRPAGVQERAGDRGARVSGDDRGDAGPRALVTAPEREDCAGRASPVWLGRRLR